MKTLPVSYLHECLTADFENGTLTWRTRPLEHFKNTHGYNAWNSRYPGTGAFTTSHSHGYKCGMIGGRTFLAHRVIFALYHNEWPPEGIDHINQVRDDNRIINLRVVSQEENLRNQRKQSNNTSGVNGVGWYKPCRKWQAYIKIEGKQKHLGLFDSLIDAVAERKHAEKEHGFHPNHGRD